MQNKNDAMNVVISIKDDSGNYSKYAGVVISSIFNHLGDSDEVKIHIFNDGNLPQEAINNFIQLGMMNKQEIKFYSIELAEDIRNLPMIKKGFLSEASLYRLLIAEKLDKRINKALYLDCDIIVNGNIRDIFNVNLKYSIAAVKDCGIQKNYFLLKKNMAQFNPDSYFNAGVILFNLERIRREHNLLEECLFYLRKYDRDPFTDQSALNYVFENDCMFLPIEFNMPPCRDSIVDEAVIWHFSGANKPWKTRFSAVDSLWWEEIRKTPWGKDQNELFKLYSQVVDPLDYALLHYPSGSKRAFFKNLVIRLKKELVEIIHNYYK